MCPPNPDDLSISHNPPAHHLGDPPKDSPTAVKPILISGMDSASASDLSSRLRQDLRQKWQGGEAVRLEDYLDTYPALGGQSEVLLGLISEEMLLRQERGENPQLTEYLTRFPDHQEALRRQFERHRLPAPQAVPVHAAGESKESAAAGENAIPDGGTLLPSRHRHKADTKPIPAAAETRGDNTPCGNTKIRGLSSRADLIAFLAPPQAADELGRLGPYRVLEVLGLGAMGVVYRAEDPHLRRFVALKAMLPTLADEPVSRERFLREARAAAAVEHDNVVAIYHVSEDRGVPYMAMALLKGETLETRLRREKQLPLAEVLRIGREMAEGLQAAHEQGLVHRDVKPANVWMEEKKGRVKLLDFGLARAVNAAIHLTQKGDVLGTPLFMAPEQGMGEEVDARSDLFSLGCVLYRALTGKMPFSGPNPFAVMVAVATQELVPIEQLNPEVPNGLAALVRRLLTKDREQRPSSAQEVADTLQMLAEASANKNPLLTPIPDPIVSIEESTGKSGGRVRRAVVLGLSAAVVVLACLLLLSLLGNKELRQIVQTRWHELTSSKSPATNTPPEASWQPPVKTQQDRSTDKVADVKPKMPELILSPVPDPTPAAVPRPRAPDPEPKPEELPLPPPDAKPSAEAENLYRHGLELLWGTGARLDEAEAVRCFMEAEKKGHPLARAQLVLCCQLGQGVASDKTNAPLLADKDQVALAEAATEGNPYAQEILGSFYHEGLGAAQDFQRAAEWYRLAAEKGNPQAMRSLGVMYTNGRGVEKDLKQAADWFRQAAERGHALAMTNLASMYANGEGIDKNQEVAVRWFRKAADKGDVQAMNELGIRYLYGRGVRKDEAEAVRWYHRAAERGDAAAMNNLGAMYTSGRGTSKNETEAARWYRKAADKGHVLAMMNLASMYASGRGVNQDDIEAVRCYRKAAEKDNMQAMMILGRAYADGRGVDKDEDKAVHWFRKAGEKGNPQAMNYLGVMYANGRGVDRDEKEAVRWYHKAAEMGYPLAMRNLGRMYEVGRGVQKDVREAIKWYGKASDNGDELARERLKELESSGGPSRKNESAPGAKKKMTNNNSRSTDLLTTRKRSSDRFTLQHSIANTSGS